MIIEEQIQRDFEAAQKNGYTGTLDNFRQYYAQNQNQQKPDGESDSVTQFKQAVDKIAAEEQMFRMRELPQRNLSAPTAESDKIWGYDKKWVIGLSIVAIVIIAIAGAFVARALRKSGEKTKDNGGGSLKNGEQAPESVAAAPVNVGASSGS